MTLRLRFLEMFACAFEGVVVLDLGSDLIFVFEGDAAAGAPRDLVTRVDMVVIDRVQWLYIAGLCPNKLRRSR